jgi:hypothetical protein
MFSIKLIKQEFDKCSRINTLMKMKSKKKICDIQMRYNLLILESVEDSEMTTNFVQSRTTAKATFWVWHFRLEHCHSTIIKKLKVLKDITVKKKKNQKRSNARHVHYQKCIESCKNRSQQKQLSHFRSCILIWQLIIRRSMISRASLISQTNLRVIIERTHWSIIKRKRSYQCSKVWSINVIELTWTSISWFEWFALIKKHLLKIN